GSTSTSKVPTARSPVGWWKAALPTFFCAAASPSSLSKKGLWLSSKGIRPRMARIGLTDRTSLSPAENDCIWADRIPTKSRSKPGGYIIYRRYEENAMKRIFLACLLLAVTPLLAQTGAKNGEWPTYGGDLGNTRYSALDQINAANFDKLEVAWRF